MRKLITILVCAAALASAQSFPGQIYTPLVARDNLASKLTVGMASGDAVAIVDTTSGWAANIVAYICDSTTSTTKCTGTYEAMLVTNVVNANTLAVTRAYAGTSAIAHSAGKTIANAPTAVYSNTAHAEIAAIETALGPNLENITAAISSRAYSFVVASAYNFTPQTPGGSLISGNTTITLNPVPLGVNGTDTNHRVYISAGTGTAEACQINGGTGVAGSPGQIILNCANAHSGAWTIQSASAGIREAAQAVGMAGTVYVGQGTSNIYGTLVLPTTISLKGTGTGINGSGVATKLVCAAAASPCIAVADGLGSATGQGIGTHSGYLLYGPASGIGLWIGGDPAGVFAPAIWYGSYTRFEDITVDNFATALYYQNGNFVSFHRSLFVGLTRALLIPSTANYGGLGNQPIGFYDCILTVPTGAAVQMDESGFDTTGLYFSGGQVSGTITGTAVDWTSDGTHYEPNSVNTPIVTLGTSTELQQVRIFGGLMSTHGSSTPYHIGVSGSGYYNITVKDVFAQCDLATTVPVFVSYATSTGGALVIDNVFLAPAGVFTDLYTFTPSAGATPGLVVRQPHLTWAQEAAAASTLAFPAANFPVAATLAITGGTLGGSGVTAVSGLLLGQSGTFYTTSVQTFTAGATVGNTITTTAGVPYTYFFDGTRIWIH